MEPDLAALRLRRSQQLTDRFKQIANRLVVTL